jgi:hypothetical protein
MLTQSIIEDSNEGTIQMYEPPEYMSEFINDFENKLRSKKEDGEDEDE